MLISFYFKNSHSFPDETLLDMKAATYKEHPDHLTVIDNRRIKKTMAIYGANASGKTNLLRTLISFYSFVSVQLFPDYGTETIPFSSLLYQTFIGPFTPFWHPEGHQEPQEMVITFHCDGHLYEYGFSLLNHNILAEHLTCDHHLVFIREGGQVRAGRFYSKVLAPAVMPSIDSRWLMIRTFSGLDIPGLSEIMQSFKMFFSNRISYYFDFIEELNAMNSIVFYKQAHDLMKDPDALEYGLAQLRNFGIPAVSLIMDQGIPKLGYQIKSRDSGNFSVHYVQLDHVSKGTLKHLSLFEKIYGLVNHGGTLLIDSMSNNFHPAVTRSIINLFQNKANRNAQLIFTTYDVSILNNQQFRRDEVAFVDMNAYNESHLYTLADIKVRSDASFSKDYLLGKYGAVPILKDGV